MPYEIQKVTKRSAARQEIDTAIELMFTGGSLVATNLLAWAAVDILRGIAVSAGKTTIRSITEDYIKPEYLNEWRGIERESYNFFKHSDRDPTDEISFRPEATAIVLFYAVADYGGVYAQCTMPMYLFKAWFMSRYPSFFKGKTARQIESFQKALQFHEGQSFSEALILASDVYRDWKENRELFVAQIPAGFMHNVEL